MQKNLNDELLSDDEIDEVSGGIGFGGDFDRKKFSEHLQCIKCGRLMSKEEFFITQRCPECGGGMVKAVQN